MLRLNNRVGRRTGVLVVSSVLVAACSSVLGIEDLKQGQNDGGDAGGEDGSVGNGGSQSGTGGASNPGSGGKDSSNSGGSTSSGGTSSSGDGGSTSSTGGAKSTGGSGNVVDGSPGDAEPPSKDVHGTIIDFYGHPMAAVNVTVGSKSVATQADGKFAFTNVPDNYDVTFSYTAQHYGYTYAYLWVYVGLSRRDPTLQTYHGSILRDGEFNPKVTNVTFPLADSQVIHMAFGSPDGTGGMDLNYAEYGNSQTINYFGPQNTFGNAHALLWNFAGDHDLPTKYLAHDTRSLALSEAGATDVTFDLDYDPAGAGLDAGNVSGTVTSPSNNGRRNKVFLRYADGAVTQIVDDYSGPSPFSYLIPSVPQATATVAAIDGDPYYLPFALAYKDDVVPGQSNIALAIPEVPVLVAPAGGSTTVAPGTTAFRWNTTSKVSLLHIEAVDTYDFVYVVTGDKEAIVPPESETGVPIPGSTNYSWMVETVGYPSVDAASGPKGFMDPFFGYDAPDGTGRGSGSYAISAGRGFTTAP